MADESIARVFQLLREDHNATLDRTLKSVGDGLDQYHKMLLLPVAIAGIVVPLVGSQRAVANVVLLRHAIVWLCIAIVVGVLEIAIGRWLFIYQLTLVGREYKRKIDVVGAAAKDVDMFARLEADIDAGVPALTAKLNRMTGLALFGDVLFYGTILGGIIEVARAALKS